MIGYSHINTIVFIDKATIEGPRFRVLQQRRGPTKDPILVSQNVYALLGLHHSTKSIQLGSNSCRPCAMHPLRFLLMFLTVDISTHTYIIEIESDR